jgi:hypothetical protein
LTKLVNAQFTTVHERLEAIEVQTTKTNGTVQEHAKIIAANIPHNIINCPQAEKIDRIEKAFTGDDAVKEKEKRDKEFRHSDRVRTYMVAGIVVTILFSLYTAISSWTMRKNDNYAKKIYDTTYVSVPRGLVTVEKPEFKPDTARINNIVNGLLK